MRLIPALTALAPFLVKGPAKRPIQEALLSLLAITLIGVGSVFLLIALYIWLEADYGAVVATASVGTLLILVSVVLLLRPKGTKLGIPAKAETDILVKSLPEDVRKDPVFLSVLKQVDEHPLTATLGALSLGIVIAHQYFGDQHEHIN